MNEKNNDPTMVSKNSITIAAIAKVTRGGRDHCLKKTSLDIGACASYIE